MGDWLGTGNIAPQDREYLSFTEARRFVQSLGLKTGDEWVKYSKSGKKPSNIPRAPDTVYEKEWKGMGDWLGMEPLPQEIGSLDHLKS